MCLKKLRDLLDAGVSNDKLKIRYLLLFNDGMKIELPRKNAEPDQQG